MRPLIFVAFAALSVACTLPPQDRPSPIVLAMRCVADPALIVYRTENDGALLLIRGKAYSLTQARSASGARYVSTFGTEVEWWNKGEDARLSVAGEFHAECTPEPSTSGVYVARGNEPFWRVELNGSQIFWTPMEGAAVKAEITEVTLEVNTLHWRTNEALEGTLSATNCTDSMSGQQFPHTFLARVGNRTHHGCGGARFDTEAPPP